MRFERKGLGMMEEQGRLALAFQELLTVTVRLRSGRHVPTDVENFRTQIRELLVQADEEARGSGYPAEFVKLAVYVTIAFLDEAVLNTSGPLASAWAGRPMQEEIFEDHVAGERFFQHLEDLLARQDSPFVADILEVLLLCLHLGFQGRYAGTDGGELGNLIILANDKITNIRGSAGPLSPRGLPAKGEVLTVHADSLVKRLGFAAAGVMVGIVLMIGVLRVFSLSPRIGPIQELVDQELSASSVGPPAARTGTVVVRGLPAGGIVLVDGSGRGGTTFDLGPGQHRISMSATGYESATVTVSVTAAEVTTVRFPATRVVATVDTRPGRLQMRITPVAAFVWLDGDSLGDRNRLELSMTSRIRHVLEFRRENFVTIDTTVFLQPGETRQWSISLIPSRP